MVLLLILLFLMLAAAAWRAVWRLGAALPRSNADFALPGSRP
jgi:hypothetical protein